MSKRSRSSETLSHFVIALVGATVILGATAWAFIAFDNGGCSGGIECRTAEQMAQVNY